MKKYICRRLLTLIPILLGITFLAFSLLYLSPSDPAEMILTAKGVPVTPELLAGARIEMGLDKPFLSQYVHWLGRVLRGDLGMAFSTQHSVAYELKRHLPYTLALAFAALLATLLISVPLGVFAALRQNRFADVLIRICSFIGNAIPGFFLSLLLIFWISLKLHWLPAVSESRVIGIILPTTTLVIAMSSKYIRQVRAAILEELDKDYVKGARSRGVPEHKIIFSNVLKNAILSIVTLIGLSLGSLMGGTAIVEIIFVWPGVGKMALDAIRMRDYPLVQGFVLWMALIFVLINLGTDLVHRVLDPRMQTGGA